MVEGDRNTKFYHTVTARRRTKNRISRIFSNTTGWTEDQKEIANIFNQFFQDIFSEPDHIPKYLMREKINQINPPKLSDSRKQWLEKPFTQDEVKEAVFQLGPFKSPRIDGHSTVFYQKLWHIVGPLTCASTLSFLNSGHLLKELNKTLIALIPKLNPTLEE
ncbi:hypothetical protein DITRI_Ditri05aG0072500 [Diplodiscus trichospermus]